MFMESNGGGFAFKYGLDEHPPLGELLLYGLQWLAITIPTIIIIGKVVAGLGPVDYAGEVVYIQKMFFVMALAMIVQVLWGHQLPLVTGPATVLLIGVVASQRAEPGAIYFSILICGLILAIISVTGIFGYLKRLFTPQVVATVLLLIAFTLTPTIMNLLTSSHNTKPFYNLLFAFFFIFAVFVANRLLKGFWQSTLIVWATLVGSFLYYIIFDEQVIVSSDFNLFGSFFTDIGFQIAFHPGVFVSFLVCFLALAINDLGSIQSVNELIKPKGMEKRISRGIFVTGISNVLSGIFAVIGPVNFSFSPGVIASTRVASRFPLIPAGIGLLVLAFMPAAIAVLSSIPSVVIGSVMIYIMSAQIAAGLLVAFHSEEGFNFENGLVIGLPLLLGVVVSFLPDFVLISIPTVLRPLLSNGFVVGVLAVLILEHIIYRSKK